MKSYGSRKTRKVPACACQCHASRSASRCLVDRCSTYFRTSRSRGDRGGASVVSDPRTNASSVCLEGKAPCWCLRPKSWVSATSNNQHGATTNMECKHKCTTCSADQAPERGGSRPHGRPLCSGDAFASALLPMILKCGTLARLLRLQERASQGARRGPFRPVLAAWRPTGHCSLAILSGAEGSWGSLSRRPS